MNIKTAKIVEILPTEIWYEKDMMGTVNVKIQHQGMDPFTFIQIHYDYAYTSNSHQWDLVRKIGKLLGVEEIEERAWQMPESWKRTKADIDAEARELIIGNMCMTYRHDYGLDKPEGALPFQAGMTEQEREALWQQMAQIFDNDISPVMELKK